MNTEFLCVAYTYKHIRSKEHNPSHACCPWRGGQLMLLTGPKVNGIRNRLLRKRCKELTQQRFRHLSIESETLWGLTDLNITLVQ